MPKCTTIRIGRGTTVIAHSLYGSRSGDLPKPSKAMPFAEASKAALLQPSGKSLELETEKLRKKLAKTRRLTDSFAATTLIASALSSVPLRPVDNHAKTSGRTAGIVKTGAPQRKRKDEPETSSDFALADRNTMCWSPVKHTNAPSMPPSKRARNTEGEAFAGICDAATRKKARISITLHNSFASSLQATYSSTSSTPTSSPSSPIPVIKPESGSSSASSHPSTTGSFYLTPALPLTAFTLPADSDSKPSEDNKAFILADPSCIAGFPLASCDDDCHLPALFPAFMWDLIHGKEVKEEEVGDMVGMVKEEIEEF
ncbi:hypothetical protein JCM11251_005614 [Rhodosporidiobolus azoricus]